MLLWLLLACAEDCPVVDADGDGAIAACPGETTSTGAIDCDDNDPNTRPGYSEVCDGVDNDCDGDIDNGLFLSYYIDSDGDGYGDLSTEVETCEPPEGYIRVGGDCDDADPEISPLATEVCDGIDNDCDGAIDDGAGAQTWYADVDEDGTPGEDTTVVSCDPPDGYYAPPDVWDCNDSDPEIGPHAFEVCDDLDNDCNGQVDEGVPSLWYVDEDKDGFGGNRTFKGENCYPDPGYSLNSDDCDDQDAGVGETSPYPLDGNALVSAALDMDDVCPCYATVSGALRIKDLKDSTDLSGLYCVEQVGELSISNTTGLVSLSGLDALTTIDGKMTIEGNALLEDVLGLDSLTEVGGSLDLVDNPLLSDLSAFSSLASVGSTMTITDNPLLSDLSAFSSLTDIGGALTLADNDAMTFIGLEAVEQVGKIDVSSCAALEDFTTMTALVETRAISIQGCSALTGISFPALEVISDDFYIYNQASLAELSAPLLTEVGGELRVHWAADVVDLNGLSGLMELGSLFVWGNSSLTDVSGLENVSLVRGDFTIGQNPDLATGDAEALRDAIGTANIRGTVTISNNGP